MSFQSFWINPIVSFLCLKNPRPLKPYSTMQSSDHVTQTHYKPRTMLMSGVLSAVSSVQISDHIREFVFGVYRLIGGLLERDNMNLVSWSLKYKLNWF